MSPSKLCGEQAPYTVLHQGPLCTGLPAASSLLMSAGGPAEVEKPGSGIIRHLKTSKLVLSMKEKNDDDDDDDDENDGEAYCPLAQVR